MPKENIKLQFNYPKICISLLEALPLRQKQIVSGRFGLENGQPKTLQEIGDFFNITRERVRQIEKEALYKLSAQQNIKELENLYSFYKDYFERNGKIKREDLMLSELSGDDKHNNCVYFLLVLGDMFHREPESEHFYSFWTLDNNISSRILDIINKAKDLFNKENKPLEEEILVSVLKNNSKDLLLSSFEVAKEIERGPLGAFGLVYWPEIKPKGVKDMAYLALRKNQNPLHFREIAQVANDLLGGKAPREVLPQTLHNELIRDDRFVLVGRGIYALKEWGYNNGTVRDIISELIKRSETGLTKEEIVKGVMSQRLVKENTILLNLHNKRHFNRNLEGRYSLKS